MNSSQSQSQSQKQSQSAQLVTSGQPHLHYQADGSRFDEVFDHNGHQRQQWSGFLSSLEKIGHSGFAERHAKANRILRDDGASYVLNDEKNQQDRTWDLDLIPLVLNSDEWARIESGLRERAELYNLILKDIYGERQLINRGLLPPEVIHSHGGFLRACNGVFLPGDQQLLMHSCDVTRQLDGSMIVVSDRTQVPNGVGFALENRSVTSRVLPSIFRESNVHRLSPFFQKLRAKLISLSSSENIPCVIVLTSGHVNEAYFEHAYLANYLGFPLVQGGDLITRNGFVWMKTLDGLVKVDVILRHVNDEFCDPVELRSDSLLGVPGLLNVARAGRVAIANPIGSGVLENNALLKFLPGISDYFLGRQLRLQSVNTYWAANPQDFDFIKNNLNRLVIKHIYRGSGLKGIWGNELSSDQKNELFKKIKIKPHLYTAQEMLDKPYIPRFTDKGLESRPYILRSFAVASENSYAVMPGGLTRIGDGSNTRFVSMQEGSTSKDTWVTASEPYEQENKSIIKDIAIDQDLTHQQSLPSRVVENLFWMGRYSERAEATLRILRSCFIMINSDEGVSFECKKLLFAAVSEVSSSKPGFIDADKELIDNPLNELRKLILDQNVAGSVRSTLNSMLYAADQSRELLSSDTMRVINDVRDALDQLDQSLDENLASAPEETLDPLVTHLMSLSGLMQENMIRGVGWHFIQIGKRIERAFQTANTIHSLMSVVLNEQDQSTMLTSLLTTLEVFITYRRRYRSRTDLRLALQLVMLDTSNPRSLLYQFEELKKHIDELPEINSGSGAVLTPAERASLEAVTLIKLSRLEQVLLSKTDKRKNLQGLMEKLNELCCSISDAITDKYFDHRVSGKQLVSTLWGDND